MNLAQQFETLSELARSGQVLPFWQDIFVKFYQAFLYENRWLQYIEGAGTTLLVTAMALALGVTLGSIVALVRVAHDQQRPHHRNLVLGFFNAAFKVYVTVIRGTPMMVQLLIMSSVIFLSSRNYTMVGALTLGINSGAYVSEIIRGGLMAVDPGQMGAGRRLELPHRPAQPGPAALRPRRPDPRSGGLPGQSGDGLPPGQRPGQLPAGPPGPGPQPAGRLGLAGPGGGAEL